MCVYVYLKLLLFCIWMNVYILCFLNDCFEIYVERIEKSKCMKEVRMIVVIESE